MVMEVSAMGEESKRVMGGGREGEGLYMLVMHFRAESALAMPSMH